MWNSYAFHIPNSTFQIARRHMSTTVGSSWRVGLVLVALGWLPVAATALVAGAGAAPQTSAPQVPRQQPDGEVARKSAGCLSCHKPDSPSMHTTAKAIGCTDCHGGDATAMAPAG